MPPRVSGGMIAREELLARLHGSRDAGLVLLAASPGYGKTTLMAQWRRNLVGAGARVSWLTLDAQDDDPARLCTAIGTSAGIGQLPDTVGLLVAALAMMPDEHYLMLDAGECLRNPAAWDVLQTLVDAGLPRLHVVLATRRRPLLRYGRLAAQAALCEIGDAALAFNLAETTACLAATHTQTTAARVHELTRGWPAGVRLLGAARTQDPYTQDCPAALTAYWSEVIAPAMSDAHRDFLCRLAWLGRCSTALAAAINGVTEAGAANTLKTLAGQGMFVNADARHAGWYTVHPMLAAWLRGTVVLAPQALRALHRNAAIGWLRERNHAEALAHAMRADDAGLVVSVVREAMPAMPAISQLRNLPAWIDGAGLGRNGQESAMLLAAAWACTVAARIDDAHRWLAQLDSQEDVTGQIALLRASLALQQDDPAGMALWLSRLGDGPLAHPSLEVLRTGLGVRCDAMLHREMRPLPSLANAPDEIALMAHGGAALAMLIEGDAHEALAIGMPAARLAQALHGSRSVSACMCAVPVAAALLELGRTEEATEALACRADLARYSSPDVLIVATLCQARLQWLAGDRHGARTTLSDAQAHATARGLARVRARCQAQRVLFALQSADLRHAAQLQAELDTLVGNADSSPRARDVATIATLSRARVALADDRPAEALALIESIRSDNEGLGAVTDLLLARANAALARSDEARRHLESALAAGLRLGLLRTLRDEPGIGPLLDDTAPSGDSVRDEWLAQVRAPAHAEPSAGVCLPMTTRQRQASTCPERLTPRERDIMALLDQSMSNKHIAQALNLSVDTIKWNLRQIYAKLEVSTRYEAILTLRNTALRTGTA
nr:LuxR C-terminal-related transcriptional regulator [uncultured Cupriavidus sp.]